jgi:hypothetical protein
VSGVLDQAAQWLAAIGGTAGIGSLLKLGIDRRTAKSKADQVVTDTAVGLLKPLKEQIQYLQDQQHAEREVTELRARTHQAEIGWLREYVGQLVEGLRSVGADVPPPPPMPVRFEIAPPPMRPPPPGPDPADDPPPPRPRRRTPPRRDPA